MADNVEFVKLVQRMRKAQKIAAYSRGRAERDECMRIEARVDVWIDRYSAEVAQLGKWGRNEKEHEEPGRYDVGGKGEQDDSTAGG